VPPTGPGSGTGNDPRTPPAGDGGNAGGPATAGNGTVINNGSGGKASTPGTEQAACGAPGQAVCDVKMNESGMPDGNGTFTDSKTQRDSEAAKLDQAMAGVTRSGGKDTSWGIVPSWLQIGACSPAVLMTLPAKMGGQQVTFDICPMLPTIQTLMNFLWTVWTFFAVVGMVFRVTTSASS